MNHFSPLLSAIGKSGAERAGVFRCVCRYTPQQKTHSGADLQARDKDGEKGTVNIIGEGRLHDGALFL